MGTLYVVATPLGNLGDITVRALQVLRSVDLIAAEDTRTTRKLLARYEIKTAVTSYHARNARAKLGALVAELAEKDIALVSEAGTPGISDPGSELVAAAAERGYDVVPVPGPSAVTAALAVSGLPSQQFVFLGFLPSRAGERRRGLQSVASLPRTLVLLEAPHRLRALLEAMLATLGNRRVVVCREMTKLHEEVFRADVQGALDHFLAPRGEFTLVVEGATANDAPPTAGEVTDARAMLVKLRRGGMTARDAVAQASQATGLRRRELYRLWLEGARGKQ